MIKKCLRSTTISFLISPSMLSLKKPRILTYVLNTAVLLEQLILYFTQKPLLRLHLSECPPMLAKSISHPYPASNPHEHHPTWHTSAVATTDH